MNLINSDGEVIHFSLIRKINYENVFTILPKA